MATNKSSNASSPSELVKSDVDINWKSLLTKFEDLLIKYIPKIIIAIIIYLIGDALIRLFRRIFLKLMKRSKLDPTMHKFLSSLIVTVLRIFLIIIVLSYLGVPTTQFVLLLTSLSLAISFAIKDSLANISGGVLLLATKPLKVGDFVTIDSAEGTVRAVSLVYTELVTVDNKIIYVPNSELAATKIINHFTEPLRRCDLQASCSYDDDLVATKAALCALVARNRLALDLPAPVIRVAEYGGSSIIFDVKVWCESSDYEELIYTLNDELKSTFDEGGISMPYTTADINIVSLPKTEHDVHLADTNI